jgi:hypothetical protein
LQEILLKYNDWDDMLGKKLLIDIRGVVIPTFWKIWMMMIYEVI